MNVRVHPDEARQSSNFSSVQLNDGTGDLHGMPTVFHGLHCLVSPRPARRCSLDGMLMLTLVALENNTPICLS